MKPILKTCSRCKGKGLTKIRQDKLETKDTKKMLSIIKRNKLNQLQIAYILNISQGTVNGWFHEKTNKQGKIKKIYFDILTFKGIK